MSNKKPEKSEKPEIPAIIVIEVADGCVSEVVTNIRPLPMIVIVDADVAKVGDDPYSAWKAEPHGNTDHKQSLWHKALRYIGVGK